MKSVYVWIRWAVDVLDRCAVIIGCMLLFTLMLVVVSDVTLRYVFNAPLTWSYEVISTFLMPGLFFLSVSHTLQCNAHVSVDILHNYLTVQTRYALEALTSLIITPVFAFIAYIAFFRTFEQFQSGAFLTDGLQLPAWSATFLMPIGFGLLALRTFLNAIGYVSTLVVEREVLALPPISGTEGV